MFRLVAESMRLLPAVAGMALVSASIQGCMMSGYTQKGFAESDDCRFCHAPNAPSGVRDFSFIYDNPKSHHPVGVMYPLGPDSDPDYNQPTGYTDDGVIFFDDDGYGVLDNDDVRLFGKGNAVTVECYSCHREHGDNPVKVRPASEHYLRVANDESRLCITCHRK